MLLAPLTAEAGGVTVYPILAHLCLKVNCGAQYIIGPPWIGSITSTSNPTPGGVVVVVGKNFGSKPGALWLTGLNKYTGNIFTTVRLTVAPGDWHPTVIAGTIPHTATGGFELTGLRDQPAKLSITTAQPAFKDSNKYPVNFKATMDIKVLPAINLSPGDCSDEADTDRCNNVHHQDSYEFCHPPTPEVQHGTFYGFHWTCVGNSNGTDSFTFSFSKKYGWSLYSVDLDYTAGGVSQPVTTSPKVSIEWNNKTVSYVNYMVNVSIVGPKGVPHY